MAAEIWTVWRRIRNRSSHSLRVVDRCALDDVRAVEGCAARTSERSTDDCDPAAGGTVARAVGVVAAELVPDGRIGYHLIRAEAGRCFGPIERPSSPLGTTADRFSECVALSIGLGDPPGQNTLKTALSSPSYGGCDG